jgi:hypothetical protein
MPVGRSERVAQSLFSAHSLQSEEAKARESDHTLVPLSLRGRPGPGHATRRTQFAAGGQPFAAAQAARAASVAVDTKAQRKAAVQRRLCQDYVVWFDAVASVDAHLRGLQPQGALPVCHEAALEFIMQLPTMLPGGADAPLTCCSVACGVVS